ncbi:winged helix-turn-helix domain-containing protein [uncultured Methanomethylovorans sp.]|jgi:predicted transcriptional regulator|uniref:helix-turn-helix transcriptional regulator n=1 Tax=uncultured Methanomethylovorans sp. TaxID=183759 RepID=UPI002629EBDC|nr:winged helix-turn-helix domain-containing protein [uncultured Methanomethylovorans sp.]
METLAETIWFSEKRKELMFLLLEGAKTSEEIETKMGVSWRSMMLPVKELKEMDLLVFEDTKYKLSTIGRLVTENAKPVSDIMNILDKNTDYWASRDLQAIPRKFCRRLGELGDFSLIEPELKDMFELPESYVASISRSSHIMSVLSFFHPSYLSMFSDMASKGIEISVLLTESVWQRIKEDFQEQKGRLENIDNAHVFVYQHGSIPPGIVVTDVFLLLSIFNKQGRYDHRDILSFDASALQWGKDLFLHYVEGSMKVI